MRDSPVIEVYLESEPPSDRRLTEQLDGLGHPYEIHDVDASEPPSESLPEPGGSAEFPAFVVDGVYVGSDIEAVRDWLQREDDLPHRRLIIAGSGIAGLSAAIYAARGNNDPLVFEGSEPGGQLTLTTDVENYPGFPDGINGPELINRMKTQAERFGAEIEHGVIVAIDDTRRPLRVELRNGDAYRTDAIIAASGASARTLGIPGEGDLMGYGVSTCATCDGAFFRDEEMVVIGGGDAAMEEAHFLTRFADQVTIVHRRDEFRAEDYWVDRIDEKVGAGEVEILWNTEATAIHGTPEAGVESVSLVTHPAGHPTRRLDDPETREWEKPVGAVFLAIGHTPNTDYLTGTDVELDEEGYLLTAGGRGAGQTATAADGIFGAGDVVDFHYQQAATAAGLGVAAALDADDYLETLDRPDSEDYVEAAPVDSND